jgi:hypothetical protein
MKTVPIPSMPITPASPNDASDDSSTSDDGEPTSECEDAAATTSRPQPRTAAILKHLHRPGQLGPHGDGFSDDSDYFPGMQHAHAHNQHTVLPKNAIGSTGKMKARASSRQQTGIKERKVHRKTSERTWLHESGMGTGARADALGDGDDVSDAVAYANRHCSSPTTIKGETGDSILKEARTGDMTVAQREDEREPSLEDSKVIGGDESLNEDDVDKMKDAERKGYGEIY